MIRFSLCVVWVTMVLVSSIVSAAVAQSDIRTEPIQFKTGALSTVVEGSITGSEIVDYIFGAGKGQYLNVSMVTDNNSNYFNILAPGENEVAFYNGSTSDNQYEGTLPAKGEYKIRVYQMRSAARRNEIAHYNLEIILTNTDDQKKTSQSASSQSDAVVQGTKKKATDKIVCIVAKGKPKSFCSFKVTREGKKSSIFTITRPDGSIRAIFFENGKAVGADVSQADPAEFSAKKKGNLNIIRVGDEHYEIPDAVIF